MGIDFTYNEKIVIETMRHVLISHARAEEAVSYEGLWTLLREEVGDEVLPEGLWRISIGRLLHQLCQVDRAHGSPLLASLVVNKKTGEVGSGYKAGCKARYDYEPELHELHAQDERRRCYTYWGK